MKRNRSRRRLAAVCVLAAAAAATACASPGSDAHGLGARRAPAPRSTAAGPEVAPKPVPAQADAQARTDPLSPGRRAQAAEAAGQAAAAREAAARTWGLSAAPILAPPAPAAKPALAGDPPHVITSADLPPVVRRVPTADKVVFLTVDDGMEKDPEFSRMLRELGVPISAFVSDYLIRPNYGYFRDLRDQGVAVHNHTINHRDLRTLGHDALRSEICGQQDNLTREMGERPRLFRPPYGEYTAETLRIAGSCGITAVPLWNEEAFPDRIEYRYGDHKLVPGDIILTHFRGPATWSGSMTDMLRRVIREATAQGFAIARLEDYI